MFGARSRVRPKAPRPASVPGPVPFAAAWHLGGLALLGIGAAILGSLGLFEQGPDVAALGAVATAAVVGAVLAGFGRAGPMLSVLIWAVAGAVACHLTGGINGPLAVWCLAPAAAAMAHGQRQTIALGTASALGASGVSALDTAFFALPQSSVALDPWLSLMALGSLALGVAVALIHLGGRVTRDANRLAKADQALELLSRQPLLIATLGPGGRVLTANGPALGRLATSDLIGRLLPDLVDAAHRADIAQAFVSAVQTGKASLYAAPENDPDGWFEITLSGLGEGHILAAIRDAREQLARERRNEAARLAAENQNAGKSRFLANMSHELRTPLNAIMGFSDIMRQRLFGPMADRYAEYSELIHESGAHLLELINDVLDMSKIEASRYELSLETFDAGEAVEAVLRLMRGQADRVGVHLRGLTPTDALYADADRRALKQIAINLISNALKFTPRGGVVTVTLQSAGPVLELLVSDTGVGIAQNDLERLGQPYEQAGDAEQRAAGSGLGLSLVRAFARLHGGDMAMKSTLGEGTSVTVRLPVLSADVPDLPPLELPFRDTDVVAIQARH